MLDVEWAGKRWYDGIYKQEHTWRGRAGKEFVDLRGPLEFKGEHEFMKTMKTSPKHRPRSVPSQNSAGTSPGVVTKRCSRRLYHGYYLETKNGGGGNLYN